MAVDDRTVTLLINGIEEARYTVAGNTPKIKTPLHEAVLFGSGDDFNGMSAIIDGVAFHRTQTLGTSEAHAAAVLYTPLEIPPILARPLLEDGPDTIFDQGLNLRVGQLVLPPGQLTNPKSGEVLSGGAGERDLLAFYLVAHALGCQRAHLALGHRYLYGVGGVAPDCKLAAHYYLYAAERGVDDMIQSNINTTRDVDFRLEETPSSTEKLFAGLEYYAGIQGTADTLIQRLIELANPSKKRAKGDPEAQYWLAKHYYWGRAGLAVNFTATAHYNRMAADQGHVEALQFMGILYAKGHGVETNTDIGLDYSTRAAAKGNLAAHNTIGYYHERAGDYITALKHFKLAAEGNNSYGHYNIALLYTDGLGTLRQDTQKALKHFILSAELGHPSCMLMMGFYYLGLTDELGEPIIAGAREPRDCAHALRMLAPVAEIGDWGSFRQHVAELYAAGLPDSNGRLTGRGGKQDPQKSDLGAMLGTRNMLVRELVLGSELGYAGASTNLAWLLSAAVEQRYYSAAVQQAPWPWLERWVSQQHRFTVHGAGAIGLVAAARSHLLHSVAAEATTTTTKSGANTAQASAAASMREKLHPHAVSWDS